MLSISSFFVFVKHSSFTNMQSQQHVEISRVITNEQ